MSRLKATCTPNTGFEISRKDNKLAVWLSSSSTPGRSRSETGGKNIIAIRSGEGSRSAAATVQAMMAAGEGEEYRMRCAEPLPPDVGRGGSAEARAGIHGVDATVL